MGGRSVPAGPDHPAPARHPGRCDRFADARGPLDSLRWQAAGQVVPLLRPLPHPQRSGSPVVVALIGAAVPRGGRRPGRVFCIFRQIFAVLHPQDPLPIQPSPLQLFQTGIPSQVHNRLFFRPTGYFMTSFSVSVQPDVCVCRCLMQLDVMRAFRRCCPFHKEIRGEIVAAVRKGAAEWFTFELQRYTTEGNCRRRLLFINMKQGNRGDAHLIFRRYCLVRALIFISTFSILLLCA